MESAEALGVVDIPPVGADRPRAEADRTHVTAGLAEPAVLHRPVSSAPAGRDQTGRFCRKSSPRQGTAKGRPNEETRQQIRRLVRRPLSAGESGPHPRRAVRPCRSTRTAQVTPQPIATPSPRVSNAGPHRGARVEGQTTHGDKRDRDRQTAAASSAPTVVDPLLGRSA